MIIHGIPAAIHGIPAALIGTATGKNIYLH